jgi:hypothetical protein
MRPAAAASAAAATGHGTAAATAAAGSGSGRPRLTRGAEGSRIRSSIMDRVIGSLSKRVQVSVEEPELTGLTFHTRLYLTADV